MGLGTPDTGLPRATAYYQPRQRSARGLDEALVARIRRLHQEEPNCGVRGTWSRLRFRDGLLVNRKKVHRIMKLKGWTLPKRRTGRRPRVEASRSVAECPNQRWATDLALVHCGRDGWCVFVPVIDCCTREVLGHAVERNKDARHSMRGHWSYTYNTANQLTRWEKYTAPGTPGILEAASYTYDANGNRLSKVVDGTTSLALRTTTYIWDSWNRLAEVLVPVTATSKKSYEYTYDYRMRRKSLRQSGGGLKTHHTAVVFNGGLSVTEFRRSSNSALSATSLPWARYLRGPDMGGGVGGLLGTLRHPVNSSEVPVSPTVSKPVTERVNLSNGRGDIVAQSDAAGTLTWTASYEAYGKRTLELGSNEDRQRANTKEEDPTGLLNEGFRYRDIETGVWLSRDPAGFVDGPNLYAYVKQNPWTSWDPDGLAVNDKGRDVDDKTGKWNPAAQLYRVKYNPDDPKKTSIVAVSAKDIQKKNALIWVNGMDNNRDHAAALGANHTGSNDFYMIHNPSNGPLKDGGECIPNKLGLKTTVATTTTDILRNFDLKSSKIVAHSQGTMILNHALRSLDAEGISMTGMRTDLDGAAANTWRFGRFLKSVGAEKPHVTGHALDPVHNIIGMNTVNPLRIAGSIVASPLVFLGGKDFSPHTTKDGGKLPGIFKSPLFYQITP